MSENDKMKSLTEKSSAILSLLTIVASRPENACRIHEDTLLKPLFHNLSEDSGDSMVTTFYQFLNSADILNGKPPSHINHLDALLRHPSIRQFFYEYLGLLEAWILFVDNKGEVKQLWLHDRANSVVFPEKDKCINCWRIKKLQVKLRGAELELLTSSKPEAITECLQVINVGNGCQVEETEEDLKRWHYYRKWLASYLVKKNKEWHKSHGNQSPIEILKAIPAFAFLGDMHKMVARSEVEKSHLVLLSRPKEYWPSIKPEALSSRLPFDAFALEAFFAHIESQPTSDEDELLFFSLPLDPVNLVEKEEKREHGAIWSGFIQVTHDEANSIQEDASSMLLRRLQILRTALNILGQPCVRKQLENQLEEQAKLDAELSIGRKHADMVDSTRDWVENIMEDLQKIDRRTQHLHSYYFAPHRALFAAAPRLKPLFDSDNEVKINDTFSIKGIHNEGSADTNAFKQIIAASVLYILAAKTKSIRDEGQLFKKANDCLEKEIGPVADICKQFVGSQLPDYPDDEEAAELALRKAFRCIKQTGFTPFKQDKKWPLLPMVLTLSSVCKKWSFTFHGPSGYILEAKDLQKYIEDDKSLDPETSQLNHPHLLMQFKEDIHYFPIVQYNHFLDFLGGVLSYAVSKYPFNPVSCVADCSQENKVNINIKLEESGQLIDQSTFLLVLLTMEIIIKEHLLSGEVYGDFRKPFLTLAQRCAPNTKVEIKPESQMIELTLDSYLVQIGNDSGNLLIIFQKKIQ